MGPRKGIRSSRAAAMKLHAEANRPGQLDVMRELGRDRGRVARVQLDPLVERRDEAQRERAVEHLEATPDAGPGLVVRQQPRGRAVLVEDLGGLVGLEAVGPLTGDAATTLDRRADVLGPALG